MTEEDLASLLASMLQDLPRVNVMLEVAGIVLAPGRVEITDFGRIYIPATNVDFRAVDLARR